MKDQSKADFVDFVKRYAEIANVSPKTADNIRGASLRFARYIPDGSKVATWDSSTISNAFRLNNPEMAPESIKVYESRFRTAVNKFLAYSKGEYNTVASNTPYDVQQIRPSVSKDETTTYKTFELPIPLRDELTVFIGNLPRDLSPEEAQRISAIVTSFAIPAKF